MSEPTDNKPEAMEESKEVELPEELPKEVLQNPDLLAAVQAKLNKLVGTNSNLVDHLPQCVKNRINALKNIQVEWAKLEGKFYEDAHKLEMKYAELFKPLYEKRSKIVNAEYEPSSEEATWKEPGENEEENEEKKPKEEEKADKDDSEKTAEQALIDDLLKNMNMDDKTKGIPGFWLTAMKNADILEENIQEHDEEILKHLIDIKLIFTGKIDDSPAEEDSQMGFVLEFVFSPNEYFSNSALTKTYKMKCEPDSDDPFSFEGPDIVSCTGCKIDWNKGKNVTEKQVKKKQKHKGLGQTRIVVKTVKNDSFFNFFSPPEVPDEEDEADEDTEALLSADFEIGHYFRERLIPKAVLYYTGEAIEEESDDEDLSEFDEDDDEDDDDDDDDDEDNDDEKKGEKPQECKQQ